MKSHKRQSHQNHHQNKCYKTVTSEWHSRQKLQNTIMSESHSKQLLQNTITSGITFKNATKHNWEREALSRRLNLSYVHGRTDCPPRCHHHLLDQSQLQSRSMHYAEALLEHHSWAPEQPGTIIEIRNSVFFAFHQFYCIIPHDWPQRGEKKPQEKHTRYRLFANIVKARAAKAWPPSFYLEEQRDCTEELLFWGGLFLSKCSSTLKKLDLAF